MTGESSNDNAPQQIQKPKKSPLPNSLILHATDMSEEMRHSAITIADTSFKTPVSHGKVYGTIADLIRVEFGKLFDTGEKDATERVRNNNGGRGSGWNCVVGDCFGSCVSHRMKTYM